MKKGLKSLAIAGMVGLAAVGMAACGEKNPPEQPKPYIALNGFDSTYIQGEELNLAGAKVLYYESENDTTADEVELTAEMVKDFSTTEAGNKKMKVCYNNVEVEVNYTVKTEQQIFNIINNSIELLYGQKIVHMDHFVKLEIPNRKMEFKDHYNILNDKCYAQISAGSIDNQWTQKEGDKWYRYTEYSGGNSKQKVEITKQVDTNIQKRIFSDLGFIKYDKEGIEEIAEINYNIDGDKTIFILKHSDSAETQIHTFVIKDGIILSEETNIETKYEKYSRKLEFSYNIEDVVMVDAPTDLTGWTVHPEQ